MMHGFVSASIASTALSVLLLLPQSSLQPRPATAPAVDEVIYKGFPIVRDITRADAEKILGKAVSVSETEVKNHRLTTLRFTGLILELRQDSDGSHSVVSSIELRNNRWHFPAKLRIGSTRADMFRLLGKPDIEHPMESVYGCYECVFDDKIHFTFDGNKIKSMKWDFYPNESHPVGQFER